MNQKIEIVVRPEWITYDDIHTLLFKAHETNRKEGFHVKTADMDAQILEQYIGKNGACFVALDGEKLVGCTAVRIVSRNNRFASGPVADQILVAVLPEYSGNHVSSALHEKIVAFAKEHGLSQIELRTAADNHKMQRACLKWGFRYINFAAYSNIDHYTVVMMKWLIENPYSEKRLNLLYGMKKVYIKVRYKPGGVKRFGI